MLKRVALIALSSATIASAYAGPAVIDLDIGANKYQARGGECKSAAGSIYGLMATQFNVSHREGKRSLNVTLWQAKPPAGDMLQLSFSEGPRRVEVDTIKAGTKQATKGASKSALRKSGAGGVLEIDAVAASGEKITGRIEGPAFAKIQAEGG